MDIQKLMIDMGLKARSSARVLAGAPPAQKNEALNNVSVSLRESTSLLMVENRKDLEAGEKSVR